MIDLLKRMIEWVDAPRIIDVQRGRNSKLIPARLHVALLTAYDIIEIYQIILDELSAFLDTHRKRLDGRDSFTLNTHRMVWLLRRQADNLQQLDYVFRDLYAEVRLLDPVFERTYQAMFSGKFGMLMSAQILLAEGRLPLHEDHPIPPTDEFEHAYRTLWLSPDGPPDGDRAEAAQYLHGYAGRDKIVVDIHIQDGEPFFIELERYLKEDQPYRRLAELKAVCEATAGLSRPIFPWVTCSAHSQDTQARSLGSGARMIHRNSRRLPACIMGSSGRRSSCPRSRIESTSCLTNCFPLPRISSPSRGCRGPRNKPRSRARDG